MVKFSEGKLVAPGTRAFSIKFSYRHSSLPQETYQGNNASASSFNRKTQADSACGENGEKPVTAEQDT